MARAEDQGDLDALISRVDPDRWLASRFIADPAARADVIALYAYDHELERSVRIASNPLMAEIRLTWWREVLDEIFAAGPLRRHPVAEALGVAVRRRSLPREPLESMIDGRIEALDLHRFNEAEATRWADAVEGACAVLAAASLDPDGPAEAAAPAGRAWGLTLLRRAGRADPGQTDAALIRALESARKNSKTLGVKAFPATLMVRLARHDLAGRSPGALARRWSLILATSTGRL